MTNKGFGVARQILTRNVAQSTARRALEKLGAVPTKRVTKMLQLLDNNHQVRLSVALQALFPEKDLDEAQTSLRGLRRDIRQAVEEAGHGIDFELCVTEDKRARPTNDGAGSRVSMPRSLPPLNTPRTKPATRRRILRPLRVCCWALMANPNQLAVRCGTL